MIRRWLALTYYLYALRLAALSHFYFNHYKKQPALRFVDVQAAFFVLKGFVICGINRGGIVVAVCTDRT